MNFDGIEAGLLREWLTFQVLSEVQDDFGAPVVSWSTAFEDWGEYQGLGSREFPLSQKRQAETTARFFIRYRPDPIDPATHRIVFDNKQWNLAPPIHDLKRSLLMFEANEIT